MKKLNIAIDIDDTITDTFEYLIPCVSEFFEVNETYLRQNNISYSTLTPKMKERFTEFAQTYFDKSIYDIPLKKDAKLYISKLKEDGHKIIIITARNNSLFKDAYTATKKQLDYHNIPYDKIICSFDKAKECKENNIDILIDDSSNNCKEVKDIGINVLMYSCASNRNISNFDKAYSWEEVYNYITK